MTPDLLFLRLPGAHHQNTGLDAAAASPGCGANCWGAL